MRADECVPLEVRLGRKRKPSAAGVLLRDPDGLPEDRRGIAVSTYGKVIKRGWDWLGITPVTPESIAGAFEAPELARVIFKELGIPDIKGVQVDFGGPIGGLQARRTG